MKMSSEDKLLLISVSVLAALFAILFALTFFELNILQKEKEEAESYLRAEEVVIIRPQNNSVETDADFIVSDSSLDAVIIIPIEKTLFEYVQVTGGCGPYFVGECLNARSGPGEDFDVIMRLRNGMVLKVGGQVEREGQTWYKVVFDEWIRYPERIKSDFYVAADYVRVLLDEGLLDLDKNIETTNKRIVVDRSDQTLSAYDGEELFMQIEISTGIELTPTPRGRFNIFRKTPSRYMQGPIPGISNRYWDLPGVPWNLYFTQQGAVIHGAYWHNNFGKAASNGCVNVPQDRMEKLYNWADLGTTVIVQD